MELAGWKSGSNRSFDRGRIQSIAEKAEKDEMVITDDAADG